MDFLLDMTITGSLTAIILLMIKRLFKNKLSPKWQFYIWGILLIRLLIPSLPESDFSLFKNVPSAEQNVVKEYDYEFNQSVKIYYTDIKDNNYIALDSHDLTYVKIIWLAGAFVLLTYFVSVYLLFYLHMKKLKKYEDKATLELFEGCKKQLGITKHVDILRGYHSPMLTGMIHPKVIMPEDYTMEEMEQIFYHELYHVKYGDIFYNWLNTLLLCIQWFNPIMWVVSLTIRKDMELLCDQRVLDITNNRKLYAKVLLKTALNRNKFILCTTSIQNGKKEIMKRIKFVASYRKYKLLYRIVAIGVVSVLSIFCLTNGKEIKASKNLIEILNPAKNKEDDKNLIYVIRQKYTPDRIEDKPYIEVNYYDIDDKNVDIGADDTFIAYIESEKKRKKVTKQPGKGDVEQWLHDQYTYEKSVKSINNKEVIVYSQTQDDGTLVKEIYMPYSQ